MTDERDTPTVARRQWLALAGGSLSASLAGCLGGGDSDDTSPESDDATDGDSAPNDGDDTGDDTGTDTGTANGDDTSDDNGPDPGDLDASLQALRIGGFDAEASVSSGDDRPVRVTLVSEESAPTEFPVTLTVTPADGGDPVHTETQTVPLDAGADERISFGGVTRELDPGSYNVTATMGAATASIALAITDTTSVDFHLNVWDHVLDTYRHARTGEVTITDVSGQTTYGTMLFTDDETWHSLPLPLTQTTTYRAEVTNLNHGVYPPATLEFTITPDDFPQVDLDVRFTYQAADSLHFTMYTLESADVTPEGFGQRERFGYGTYAANGNYHFHWTRGQTFNQDPLGLDTSRPEWGADLAEIRDERGLAFPHHSVLVDGQVFFYDGGADWWEPGNTPTNYNYGTHLMGLTSMGTTGRFDNPDKTQYLGTATVHGREVHKYKADSYRNAYVDPETGYTVRTEFNGIGNDSPNSYVATELFAHDEVATLDWELIQNRSQAVTTDDLDTLPWEV